MGVCLSPTTIDKQQTAVNLNKQSNDLHTMYIHIIIIFNIGQMTL